MQLLKRNFISKFFHCIALTRNSKRWGGVGNSALGSWDLKGHSVTDCASLEKIRLITISIFSLFEFLFWVLFKKRFSITLACQRRSTERRTLSIVRVFLPKLRAICRCMTSKVILITENHIFLSTLSSENLGVNKKKQKQSDLVVTLFDQLFHRSKVEIVETLLN